ncbi:serine/threonine-protein kinase [Streptomyces sp. SAJ15]|uniref:serine/threonine-protein kinase n=1 Tax=Streptomyces sp. SAJ15 TaxID=2011095 RepID=UPI001186C2EC|nr:serine/threonine-protein kinase [Streptomyces sp. SAJ15]TVL90215.1 serine/threonine protein kinase [Streptomyces sp. SAJ15]
MTNLGGRANEPTSYGLQPPQAPASGEPVVPPAGAGPRAGGYGPPHPAVPAQDAPARPLPTATVTDAAGGPDPRPGMGAGTGAAEPDSGRVIGGRYRLLSRLGHGGMGTVWKAHDQVVDRHVAVKEPRVPDHLSEQDRQNVYLRMQREARAAARIDHPSVVTVHDVVMEDGRPWIVMELVSGHSLGDRLAEGTLDPREAARIGAAVLGALTAAHEAGVLHRDVKPDNVLLARNDRVVLTDFGIAQVEGEQGLTETGAFVGSPEYIAPERVLGQRPGPESDLWSLGVVLYAAVEGMSPFRRSHTPATLQAILSAEPQTPARGSGALGTLIMQLLRKDPAARPTASEARQTLESVVRPPQPDPTLLATRVSGADGAATTGGSRFVPPVLHKNRKAQLGLVALVLVAAAGAALAVVNPFRGEGGLPAGWTVREEPEVVTASLAVPETFRRVVDDDETDGTSVTFNDPSGVFTISLSRVTNDHKIAASTAASDLIEWYEEGAGSEMKDAKSKKGASSKEGDVTTVDVTTTYREYGSSDDAIRYAYRDHLVAKGDVVWQLSVQMPAAGDAREDGDRLFDEVKKHLDIDGLEKKAS